MTPPGAVPQPPGPRGAAQGAQGAAAGPTPPQATPVGLVNVANALTAVRIVLVPVFVACLAADTTGWRVVALVAFWVASATDFLDGRLARNRGLVTDFGKIADPIADKALTGAALITLSVMHHLSWWPTVLILVREVGITVLRFAVIHRGVIAASRGGKLKTLLQIVAISLYVLPGPFGLARPIVMGVAVAVTLVTGADYVLQAARLPRAGAPPTTGPQGET